MVFRLNEANEHTWRVVSILLIRIIRYDAIRTKYSRCCELVRPVNRLCTVQVDGGWVCVCVRAFVCELTMHMPVIRHTYGLTYFILCLLTFSYYNFISSFPATAQRMAHYFVENHPIGNSVETKIIIKTAQNQSTERKRNQNHIHDWQIVRRAEFIDEREFASRHRPCASHILTP